MNHVLTLNRLRSSTFPLVRPTMLHTGAPTHPHYPLRPSRAFMVVCGRPSARVPTKRSHAYRGTSNPAIHRRAYHFRGWLNRLKPSLPAAKPQRANPQGVPGRVCSLEAGSTQTTHGLTRRTCPTPIPRVTSHSRLPKPKGAGISPSLRSSASRESTQVGGVDEDTWKASFTPPHRPNCAPEQFQGGGF